MQIICPLLLATSWSLTDKDWLNPQSMSFNILYKSFLLIHKALAWFPPPRSPCWVAESCSGLSERQRRVCWKMLKAGHETAPALLPASLLQFAEAADFYFLLTDFFKKNFYYSLFSSTCQLSFSYEELVSGDVALVRAVFSPVWSDTALFLHLPSAGGFSSRETESTTAPTH